MAISLPRRHPADYCRTAFRAAVAADESERAAERANDRDFPALDISEDLVPDFAMTIRPTDEGVAVENSFHVLEVDLVIAQIAFALFRIPSEVANACEQPLHVFRHSDTPQDWVAIRSYRPRVRYDGFEACYRSRTVRAQVKVPLRPYLGVVVYTYVLQSLSTDAVCDSRPVNN